MPQKIQRLCVTETQDVHGDKSTAQQLPIHPDPLLTGGEEGLQQYLLIKGISQNNSRRARFKQEN